MRVCAPICLLNVLVRTKAIHVESVDDDTEFKVNDLAHTNCSVRAKQCSDLRLLCSFDGLCFVPLYRLWI